MASTDTSLYTVDAARLNDRVKELCNVNADIAEAQVGNAISGQCWSRGLYCTHPGSI
jgi:hypothetical protein